MELLLFGLLVFFGVVWIAYLLIANSKRKDILLLWASLLAISIGIVVLLGLAAAEAEKNNTQYKELLITIACVFAAVAFGGLFLWVILSSTFVCRECGSKHKPQPIWSKKRILWNFGSTKFLCPNCKNWCKPKFTYFDDKFDDKDETLNSEPPKDELPQR